MAAIHPDHRYASLYRRSRRHQGIGYGGLVTQTLEITSNSKRIEEAQDRIFQSIES